MLSVDDDPINQMVVQNLLAPAGYEVIQAMDGAEALQILAESSTQPDMILLDVMMPGEHRTVTFVVVHGMLLHVLYST